MNANQPTNHNRNQPRRNYQWALNAELSAEGDGWNSEGRMAITRAPSGELPGTTRDAVTGFDLAQRIEVGSVSLQ